MTFCKHEHLVLKSGCAASDGSQHYGSYHCRDCRGGADIVCKAFILPHKISLKELRVFARENGKGTVSHFSDKDLTPVEKARMKRCPKCHGKGKIPS